MYSKKTSRLAATFYVACAVWVIYFYLSSNNSFAFIRFHGIGINTLELGFAERIRQAAYILNYFCALLILLLLPFWPSKIFKYFFLILFFGMYAFELTFAKIYGHSATFSDIFTMNTAVANIGDALQEYSGVLKPSLWEACKTLIPILLYSVIFFDFHQNKKRHPIYMKLAGGATLYLGFSYCFILSQRGTPALVGFPLGYSYILGTLVSIPATHGQDLVHIPTATTSEIPRFSKIIYIVDESIWYKTFQEEKNLSAHWIDMGKTWSGANCSAASNFYLRRGLKLNSHISSAPSIFQLAKQSGYKTVYLDNQNVLRDLTTRNYFNSNEISFIDEVVPQDSTTEQNNYDLNSLSKIQKYLSSNEKVFIFINKMGAHFPYQLNLPDDQRISDNRIENYRRAVKRTALNFLNKLEPMLDLQTIVFYTSDHGQRIEGPLTHCSSGETGDYREWEVPFLWLTANPKFQSSRFLHNKFSKEIKWTHFEVLESVRNAMGFEYRGMNSVLKSSKIPTAPACLVYGPPLGFFSKEPSCLPLKN